MNDIRLAMLACGMSQRETAAFLGCRIDTVAKAMAAGGQSSLRWLTEMRHLHDQQRRAASEILALWQENQPQVMELGLATTDNEAQMLGWPCVGAQMGAYRLIWENLPPGARLRLVPRNSTPATIAACLKAGSKLEIS